MEYFLTIATVSKYTGFSSITLLHWIQDGIMKSDPEIPKERKAKEIPKNFADVIRISASYFTNVLISKCVIDYYIQSNYFSVDFIGFKEKNGNKSYLLLLNEINLIKEFSQLDRSAEKNVTALKKEFAEKNGYSLATLYRKEQFYMTTDLKKLFIPIKQYHSRQMCPLTEDCASFEYFLPNAQSQNLIHQKLIQEADRLGKKVCNRCPHNPKVKSFQYYMEKDPEYFIPCTLEKEGMVVPKERYVLNRYLKSQMQQFVTYGRRGKNAWEDLYLHKGKRDYSTLKVNSLWWADHHLADVVLLIGQRQDGSPIFARPWLTVVTDGASGCIVGSVVSLHPNSDTIAECFCRAAAFTVDSPFYHTPELFYCDRGKDYKATLIEGRDYDMRTRLDQYYYLNRAFCDNPLLPALNVTVRHARARTGRTKVVERTFKDVTEQYIQKLPGWTGNCPDNRPFDFYREQKKLLKNNGLWSLEKFARHWFEVIVPSYNNSIPEEKTETRLECYNRLEKANTIVPDWNTLAVFKSKKFKHVVQPTGIGYGKDENGHIKFYWHPDLRDLIHEEVMIYDFDTTFTHSISVLYKGHYICEAEPVVQLNVLESDRLKLARHLAEQEAQRKHISKRITMLPQRLKKAKCNVNRYTQYDPEEYIEDEKQSYIFVETIDEEKDAKDVTILSDTAITLIQVAEGQRKAYTTILNGPGNTEMEDFFIQQSKSNQK